MLVKHNRPGCLGMIVTWLLSAVAVWLTARFVPGVSVQGFEGALWAALTIGLLNALVRPLLVILTLPITFVTLGLFLLVINGAMVALAGYLLDGFEVNGFVPSVIAAVALTLLSSVLGLVFGGDDKTRDKR